MQDLWLRRQREAAIALIPDDLVLKTNLIGTKEMVRERVRAHQRAGVTTLLDLVNEVNAETNEGLPYF